MLKNFHIMLAYLTTLGFVVRGIWAVVDSPMRQQKWVRLVPHVIDTLLLTIGVTLVFSIGASFSDSWLVAKMLALLGYIGFGVLTMRASTKPVKLAGFLAALACVVYLFAVAFSRSPFPFG